MAFPDLVNGADPIPTEERMVWNVPSDTRAGRTYRVDLIAEGGYGRCACTDWQTRRWPAVKEGKPPGSRAVLCKHLIKVRRYFLNQVLAELAAKEESPS